MIPGVLAAWAVTASATDRVVTNTNPANVAGSLRAALAAAAPGDDVVFDPGVFPPGSQTTILLTTASGGGLTLATAGVRVEAEGRVRLRCADPMTAGTGLTITGNDAAILGLRVSDCPDHGILLASGQSTVNGGEVDGNDKFGLLVEGAAATVVGNVVTGLSAHGNCVSTAATCAGIGQRRGVGGGAGPSGTTITFSEAFAQGSGGHGISVAAGSTTAVTDNLVGVGGGNAGHGVLCAALTGQTAALGTLARNTIVSNTGSGISLGARCQAATVEDNLVGTDGAAALGNGGHGVEIFGSDDHALRGNVVSDNTGAGIWVGGLVSSSPPERLLLEDNTLGLTADGESPLGNGAEGVTLTGASGVSTLHVLRGNVIGANGGDGVRIAAKDVSLYDDVIGTNRREVDGLGNLGDGVEVTVDGVGAKLLGRVQVTDPWEPVVVSYNGGSGVRLLGPSARVTWARIGRNTDHGVQLLNADDAEVSDSRIDDNGATGITLGSGCDRVKLERNEVRENGLYGISADASNTRVRWSANRIGDNGSCGLFTVNGLNGAAGTARPVVTHVSPAKVTGTYTTVAGRTLLAIELFADVDTEYERYLGTATHAGGTFEWRATDGTPLVSASDRVTAIATFDSQYTSRPLGWCGDGCGGTSCGDGNTCTSDTCAAGVCTHATTANNQACDDGNDCTLGTTCHAGQCNTPTQLVSGGTCDDADTCTTSEECWQGVCQPNADPALTTTKCDEDLWDTDPCTAERHECDPAGGCLPEPDRRVEGYGCSAAGACSVDDHCTFDGACVAGPALEVCPEQRPGLVCTCVPQGTGCACEAIEGDGCCTPDELETDANGDLLSPDCDDNTGLSWDEDGDGFPDLWENRQVPAIDANCDGDFTDPGESMPFNPGELDLFWELDGMAEPGGHDHQFSAGSIGIVTDAYDLGGVVVTIDASGVVPHADILTQGANLPDVGTPSWVNFADVERDHFTWARRGVYHYAVNGHQITETHNENPGIGKSFGMILGFVNQNDDEGQAGVFFHEGGHTLTLGHGPASNKNVNHLSTMNYRHRKLWDVRAGVWVFDYSHDNLNDLDESAPSEVNTFFPGTADPDGDGWPAGSDCAPTDADVYPCAPDAPNDGVDQDCDGDEGPRDDADCQSPAEWGWTDKPLYLARWSCPVPGDEPWEYWAPPHADVQISTDAARRVDLDCDGFAGNPTSAGAELDGKDTPKVHRGQDDWTIVWGPGLHFQTSDSFAGRASRYSGAEEEERDPADDKFPSQPVARVADGCALPIPTSPAQVTLVPIVVYGSADYDPNDHARIRLNGADPWSDDPIDWPLPPATTADAYPDRLLQYRNVDLDHLAGNATRVSLWAEGPFDPVEERATGPYAFAHFDVPPRPVTTPDNDFDGFPNTCDACPWSGGPLSRPDGCP